MCRIYNSLIPVTAVHKKRTPKTMKTMLEPIFMYFIGMYLEITAPTAMPITVTSASPSITPMKTVSGASYSAANAITDSCVLSPSSIRAISEKVWTMFMERLSTLASSDFERSEYVPKARNAMPDPMLIHWVGMNAAIVPPINALMPLTRANAKIAPMNTVFARLFALRHITVTCVLSPSSASAIMPNEAMRGSKSMSERLHTWFIKVPPVLGSRDVHGGKIQIFFMVCKISSVLIDKDL